MSDHPEQAATSPIDLQDYYETMLRTTQQDVGSWYHEVEAEEGEGEGTARLGTSALTLSVEGKRVLEALGNTDLMSSGRLVDSIIRADKEWYTRLLGHSGSTTYSEPHQTDLGLHYPDHELELILGIVPKADRIIALLSILAVAISELQLKSVSHPDYRAVLESSSKSLKSLYKSVQEADKRLVRELQGKSAGDVEFHCEEKLRSAIKEWLEVISKTASDILSVKSEGLLDIW